MPFVDYKGAQLEVDEDGFIADPAIWNEYKPRFESCDSICPFRIEKSEGREVPFRLVVDYDGSVYPCQMLMDKKYRLGHIFNTHPDDIMDQYHEIIYAFHKLPLIDSCKECDIKNICNGGCKTRGFTNGGRGDKECPYAYLHNPNVRDRMEQINNEIESILKPQRDEEIEDGG